MTNPLDGLALHAYCRRLALPLDARDMLTAIRSAPPNRTPQTRHGNVAVWYPSKKMGRIIKAESATVEFAFLLEAEHDDAVIEFYDQPPPIPLDYRDARGHLQRPLHTADYFVFRYHAAGWEECKPTQELITQARVRPNRYRRDEDGAWRCPPGEEFAARLGLTYRVRASDQINWIAQSNWQFLDDYYHDLEHLTVSGADVTTLLRLVDAHPGITLSDLRHASGIDADVIYTAIAQHLLYVDLATDRLSEPGRTPVFRDQPTARAYTHRGAGRAQGDDEIHPVILAPGQAILWDSRRWEIANVGRTEITLVGDGDAPVAIACPAFETLVARGAIVGVGTDAPASITAEGRDILDRARVADVATAVFRNRVIHPDQYNDDEQARMAVARAAVPDRTKRAWRRLYREAESRHGSGFIGLLPRVADRGGQRKIASEIVALIHDVLTVRYDTVACAPKRGAYGEYLTQSEERGLAPVSERTFYAEARRHRVAYDQALVRAGSRAAYPLKDYHRSTEKTVRRHGEYAWGMAHLDHTEVDLELRDSHTGAPIGRCWLTLMILAPSRRIVACYLSFDPPSYRLCMMALRLCVKRHGRLPTAITVDGGPEFRGAYFEQLLALYRVRKHQRPSSEPRFGSVGERLFGTLNTEVIHHLLGNTQASTRPRTLTAGTDPRRLGVWTLAALAARVQRWADEEYDTLRHPALGQSPREAYEQSLARDGERRHKLIPYDDAFTMATLPTTARGAALVQPGRGVRMHYLDYWCEEMRDPTVERARVPVRFDPFDVSIGYAYIDGRWRRCRCPDNDLAGCTEREIQILAEELRTRHRIQHGRERVEITQKQLAVFRRENAAQEVVLRQQRHDRETKAAFAVLEGGRGRPSPADDHRGWVGPPLPVARADDPAPGAEDDTLIVLRRYRP